MSNQTDDEKTLPAEEKGIAAEPVETGSAVEPAETGSADELIETGSAAEPIEAGSDTESADSGTVDESAEDSQEDETSARDDGSFFRRNILWTLGGIYLAYTGFTLCKGFVMKTEGGSSPVFLVSGILFFATGIFLAVNGGLNFLKENKEKMSAAKTEAKTEAGKASEPSKRMSIADRAHLADSKEPEADENAADTENLPDIEDAAVAENASDAENTTDAENVAATDVDRTAAAETLADADGKAAVENGQGAGNEG